MKDIHIPCLVALASSLGLGACAGLPPAPAEPADAPLHMARNEANLRLRVAPAWRPDPASAPRLGSVVVDPAPGIDDEERAAQDGLRALVSGAFAGNAESPLRLDVRITDVKPVSPTLNVMSTLLVFVPLDTGSLRVSATVRDPQGLVVAELDEQLSGSLFDLTKAFGRYDQLRAALGEWSTRCAQWPDCFQLPAPQR